MIQLFLIINTASILQPWTEPRKCSLVWFMRIFSLLSGQTPDSGQRTCSSKKTNSVSPGNVNFKSYTFPVNREWSNSCINFWCHRAELLFLMEDAGTLWMWGIPWYNLVLHDILCYCMVSEDTLFNLKYSKLGFKRLFKYKCELFEFSANHGIQPSHVILFQEKAVWLIEAQKSRERILNILLFVQKTWFWAKNGGSYIFFRKQIHQSKCYET